MFVVTMNVLMFAALAGLGLEASAGGLCTDTRCGGAAKKCCQGSPHLQKKSVCTGSVDCDSCCGWAAGPPTPTPTPTPTPGGLAVARIMPMGDSITLGVGGGGYRADLGGALGSNATTAGHWSYSGLLYGNGGVHCGYNGQTIQWLDAVVAAKAFALQQPTHVLLMAGTNDIFYKDTDPVVGGNATVCVARMEKLLDTAFRTLPEVSVMLSGVTRINATLCANYSAAPWNPPDCPADMQASILEYNARMAASVLQQQQQQRRRVYFHDPNCLDADGTPGVVGRACRPGEALTFNASSDYFTYGIHFSQQGYAKMAKAWQKALAANW